MELIVVGDLHLSVGYNSPSSRSVPNQGLGTPYHFDWSTSNRQQLFDDYTHCPLCC